MLLKLVYNADSYNLYKLINTGKFSSSDDGFDFYSIRARFESVDLLNSYFLGFPQ
jgi:hypothetical protein